LFNLAQLAAHELHERYYYDIGLLLIEALDRLHVRLNINCCIGNVVSAIVFWPVGSEVFTATSFLLICLAVFDNIMLSLYYLLVGIPNTCGFYNTCQIFMKVYMTV